MLMDPDDPTCPIRRQGLPLDDEALISATICTTRSMRMSTRPCPTITHRYPDRVLFIVTEMCPMYCRHCTRRRLVGSKEGGIPSRPSTQPWTTSPHARDQGRADLGRRSPLAGGRARLEYIIAELRAIDHVEIIRFGTRVPVTNPFRVTEEFCQMIRKYHPIWVNTHFNHPLELTADAVAACARWPTPGAARQSDSPAARRQRLPAHSKGACPQVGRARVRPYYIYQCDLSEGIEHFRTPVSKGIEIIEHLRGHTRATLSHFRRRRSRRRRKVPVGPNYIVSQSPGKIVLRNYEGRIAAYPSPTTATPTTRQLLILPKRRGPSRRASLV